MTAKVIPLYSRARGRSRERVEVAQHSANGEPLRVVTMRRLVLDADFRTSETTMWDSLPARFRRSMRPREAVLFVNTSGTLIRLVFRPMGDRTGHVVTMVQHRYEGSRRFNMLTIQDVAERHLGVHLLDSAGRSIRTLREYFPRLWSEVSDG